MTESGGADVIIIGAGIAGLTAAIALDRAGFGVQVVERASALTQAGIALSLWPNALVLSSTWAFGVPSPTSASRSRPEWYASRPARS